MKIFNKDSLNRAVNGNGMDIYPAIIWQNRVLYILIFLIFIGASMIFVVLVNRQPPILLVDSEGRYIARAEYITEPPLNERQLEVMAKRFIQHYLSQNSATIYEDAEIALAALCEHLRRKTHEEWVNGGKLVRVLERVQISRVVFTNFKVLKYLNSNDIQIAIAGRVLVSNDKAGESGSDFNMELSARLVPLSANNYLGLEVCSISLL